MNLAFIRTAGLCMASYTDPPCFGRSNVVMAIDGVGIVIGRGMFMAIGKVVVMAIGESISGSGVDAVAMGAGIHWFMGDHPVDRSINMMQICWGMEVMAMGSGRRISTIGMTLNLK